MKKIPPEVAGIPTLNLLEKIEAEALRLRDENKKVAAELTAARKRLAVLEKKRVKPAKKSGASVEIDALPQEPQPPKKTPPRQALGTGLAKFLGARKRP